MQVQSTEKKIIKYFNYTCDKINIRMRYPTPKNNIKNRYPFSKYTQNKYNGDVKFYC